MRYRSPTIKSSLRSIGLPDSQVLSGSDETASLVIWRCRTFHTRHILTYPRVGVTPYQRT